MLHRRNHIGVSWHIQSHVPLLLNINYIIQQLSTLVNLLKFPG